MKEMGTRTQLEALVPSAGHASRGGRFRKGFVVIPEENGRDANWRTTDGMQRGPRAP